VAAAELSAALDEIAQRIHEMCPVDVIAVHVVDETDDGAVTHGYCVGPAPGAQALATLLTAEGLDPIGIGDAARRAGEPVVWARLVSEPGEIERLAALADQGGPAGALHRLMLEASGAAIPMATSHTPALGAIALVSLSRDNPVPESAVAELSALAPQIALTARNAQLTARSRRTRQTLEGVIASSRLGVIVSDSHGRLSLANAAVGSLLGIDLAPMVGRPMRVVIDEVLKWRFTNPEEFAARTLQIHADPAHEAIEDRETVDGRAIEYSSSPVRDASGAIVGRVEMLHDVTPARLALADARRLATERAQLLEREERRSHEEMALTRAAHAMASALTPREIHEILLDNTHALVGACHKSAVLASDARGMLLPTATRGFAEETIRHMTYRRGEGHLGSVVTDKRPFICSDTLVDERVSRRIVGPEGIRSFMHVPLVLGDRVYGVVSVNSLHPRAFGERELKVMDELALHAASALQNALQFEQERHVAEVLQQALLAEELPQVAGLELAALYQPSGGSDVGGDFYSAWPLADGRLAILVGDVSGKGVEAAGVTAMVRYMAEALSQHNPEPAALVQELNDLLCVRMADGALVTLVLAVVDADRDRLVWCSAGHPPPVLLDANGGLRTLDDPDPPCGVFPCERYHQTEESFAPGDLLVLYTDGLIEARRKTREFGEEGVHHALLEARDEPPDRLARMVHLAARTFCGGQLSDDVAIAVVKRTG
ncbi:MAG: SpoIIE family protein phosphatase, partial [Thermoleophilia bacterium]